MEETGLKPWTIADRVKLVVIMGVGFGIPMFVGLVVALFALKWVVAFILP